MFDFPICRITYRFGGNGPWNYMFERPPEGVRKVHYLGFLLEETDRHYIVAGDFCSLENGNVEPIHKKHFTKDCEIEFLEIFKYNPSQEGGH